MEGSDHVDPVNRCWWRREPSIVWDPLPWQYFGLSGVRDFGRPQYTQWSSTESVYYAHSLYSTLFLTAIMCLAVISNHDNDSILAMIPDLSNARVKSWKVVKRKWSRIYNILAMAWKDCVSVWFSTLFWAPCFFWASLKRIHNLCSLFYTLIGLDDGSSPFLLCSQQSLKLKRQFFWKWTVSAGTRAPGRQWAQTTEASCTKCSPTKCEK